MKTASRLTTIALTLGLGVLPAMAQDCTQCPPPRPGHGRPDRMEGRMAAELHLSEAQRAAIKALRAKQMETLAPRHKALQAARAAFKDAELKPETRPEELKALHRTCSDLAFDLHLERRAQRKAIGALLTPEQREKAAFMLGRMEGMRRAHRGPGPEGAWGHRPEDDKPPMPKGPDSAH